MKRHTLTPEEWNITEDGIATAIPDNVDGWWIVSAGADGIHIHEEEIAELYRVVFDKETNDEN